MTAGPLVAVVHCHLRPGGVTRVIESACFALCGQGCRFVVLAGEAWEPPFAGTAVEVVPGLDYGGGTAGDLVQNMQQAARRALGAPPDVWHFHNHSLGKNCQLIAAIGEMAARGARLLLQIHDFAEDGRPEDYTRLIATACDGRTDQAGRRVYPQGDHIHYATLNSRDAQFLVCAGTPVDRVHTLPNPVRFDPVRRIPEVDREEQLMVYITRGIRRKNLGELLFWAARRVSGRRWVTTLAPENPAAARVHRRWAEVAARLRLPMEFGILTGRPASLPWLLSRATAAITTSIREGFGMAFLEPWLAGCPITGRDLPEITDDFKASAVCLRGLYERLDVPLAWLGRQRVICAVRDGVKRLRQMYGFPTVAEQEERAVGAAVHEDRVDFGRLNETLQEDVLERITGDPSAWSETSPSELPAVACDPGQAARNADVIRETFGISAYGQRLKALYERVASSAVSPVSGLNAGVLLSKFLEPERFFLLDVPEEGGRLD